MKNYLLLFSSFAFVSLSAFGQIQTFNYTGSIQSYTVPSCVSSITINANGAEGEAGCYNQPGEGAQITGTFTVTPGEVLNVIVGQQPTSNGCGGPYYCGAGGGGSYVWNPSSSAQPLIAAGGGGGSSWGSDTSGPGSATTTPTNSNNNANGAGGSGGGGGTGVTSAGGGGWTGNGTAGIGGCGGGFSVYNGAAGGAAGSPGAIGGFGGGGGCYGNNGSGGGGGGYNGGGGGTSGGIGGWGGGGGGGSYNAGTNQTNIKGGWSGNGKVVITAVAILVPITGLNTSVTKVTCHGDSNGSASVTATGGSSPLTYKWMPGGQTNQTATGLLAGTYSVNVSDGCGDKDSTTVIVNQPPVLWIVDSTTNATICKGNCTVLRTYAGGGTPGYSFLWSNSDTNRFISVCPTDSTLYTTTVRDSNGCTASVNIKVNVNPLPVLTFTAAKDSLCTTDSVDALSGTPVGGTFTGSGVSGANFNAKLAGLGAHKIYYSYTNGNGCSSKDSLIIDVQVCAGIIPLSTSDRIKVYPNPFSQSITVEMGAVGFNQVFLYDMLGQQVYYGNLHTGINTINTQYIPDGIYLIQIRNSEKVMNYKIIKSN